MALLVALSGSRYHHHARYQQTPMHKGKGRGRFSCPHHRHRHQHQRSHRHSHNLINSSCNTCQRCGNEDRKMAARWLPVSHRIITTSATRTAMPMHWRVIGMGGRARWPSPPPPPPLRLDRITRMQSRSLISCHSHRHIRFHLPRPFRTRLPDLPQLGYLPEMPAPPMLHRQCHSKATITKISAAIPSPASEMTTVMGGSIGRRLI